MATEEGELTVVARLKDSFTPALKKILMEGRNATEALRSSFQKTEGQFNQFKSSLKAGSEGFKNVFENVVNLKNALIGFVGVQVTQYIYGQSKALIDYNDALNDTAERLGITTDALQELQHAALMNGVQTQAFDIALQKLNVNISEASEGTEGAVQKFSKLGVSVTDVNGKLKPTEVLFDEIANGIASIQDPALRTGSAVELFGKAGGSLVPLLAQGSAGLRKFKEEAQKMGLVVSKDAIKASAEFNDQFDILNKKITNTKIQILLPLIKETTKAFEDMTRSTQGSSEAQKSIDTMAEAVKGLGQGVRVTWNIFQIAFTGISEVLATFAVTTKMIFKNVSDIVGYGARAMWEAIKGNPKEAFEASKMLANGLKSNFIEAFDKVRDISSKANDDITQNIQDIADTVTPIARSIKKEMSEMLGGASSTNKPKTLSAEEAKQYQDMIALAKDSSEQIRLIAMEEIDVKIALQNKWYSEQQTIIGNAITARLATVRKGSEEEQAILEQYGIQAEELAIAHQEKLNQIGMEYAETKIQPAIDLAERLKVMRQGEMQTEIYDLTLKMEQEKLLLADNNVAVENLMAIHKDNVAKIEEKYRLDKQAKDEEMLRKENTINQARMNNSYLLLGTFISTAKQVAGLFKGSGKLLKSFAISEAMINTSRAVTSALAPPPTGLGPVLGPALAGLTAVKGAAEIATISAQKFAKGGFPSGRNALIQVNEQGQEAILNAHATQKMGAGNINALNNNSNRAGGITNHISYAPTITIGEGANTSSAMIIEALSKDKTRFADFFTNELSRKGYLKFA